MTATFKRSFSETNLAKEKHLKDRIGNDVQKSSTERRQPIHLAAMAVFTLWLLHIPSFQDEQFQKLLEEALIDTAMRKSLEESRVLNWCRTLKTLYPLATIGDGNCLMHAVSMAMWGCSDKTLLLRNMVYVSLAEKEMSNDFKQRWKHERMHLDSSVPEGVTLNTRDWEAEWVTVVNSASCIFQQNCSPNELPFGFLEEIHIFVLANILRRPIVVLAEDVIRGIDDHTLAPNNFSGVYLPLVWNSKECCKTPIVLGYCSNHFVPLVSMKDSENSELRAIDAYHGVPLVKSCMEPLKMHFLLNNEEEKAHILLKEFLNVKETYCSTSDAVQEVLYAKLEEKALEPEFNLTGDWVKDCENIYRHGTIEGSAPYQAFTKEGNILSIGGGVQLQSPTEVMPSAPYSSSLIFGNSAGVEPQHEIPQPLLLENPAGVTTATQTSPEMEVPAERLLPDLSMCTQMCVSPNCTFYASVKTFPYCHNCCDRRSKEALKKLPKKALSEPGACAEERQHFSSMENYECSGKLCNTAGCDMYGRKEWGGMCSRHHTYDEVRMFEGNQALSMLHLNPVATESTYMQQNTICKKQGCTNVAGNKTNDFCQICFVTAGPQSKTRCNTHGCPFGAGVNGYCSKCETQVHKELLENLPEQEVAPHGGNSCKIDGCPFVGTPEQQGYCSQHCLRTQSEDTNSEEYLTSMQILQRLPKISAEEMSNAHTFYVCITPGCRALAGRTKEVGGYCSTCYIKNVRDKKLPLLSMPYREKSLCSTPGCEGIRQKNPNGLCFNCNEASKQGKSPSQLMKENQKRRTIPETNQNSPVPTEQLLESRPRSTQAKKCKKPYCRNIAGGNMKGMCPECHADFLRDLEETLNPEPAPQIHAETNKCKAPGCEFFGTYEQGGYCHKHHMEYLKSLGDESIVNARHISPKRPATVPIYAPLINHLCISGGCDRFGDPIMEGLCTACYNRKHAKPTIQKNMFPVTYSSREPSKEAPSALPCDEKYRKMMLAKENEARKATGKCRAPGCSNYASSKYRLYCNACGPLSMRN